MAKRKEIKWRREGRGTMTGRQDGIIFRIYHAWDAPEQGHTVSCHDTRGTGRTINTAGHRKFTWEEAVEFCQAIVAGEINLEDLRAEFAAEDAKRERRAIQQAVAEAKEFRGHRTFCVALEEAAAAVTKIWGAVQAAEEFRKALRWAEAANRPLAARYHRTKKKRIRKKYAKRILTWYREEIL